MTNTDGKNVPENSLVRTSIAPWLTIKNCPKAVDFYKSAFEATEVYRLETPEGGLVVKLSVDGAEFWVSGDAGQNNNLSTESYQEDFVRMILTVKNPEVVFDRALKAGALQIFPVQEDYGWKLGRLSDPFGLHWEIGHPL